MPRGVSANITNISGTIRNNRKMYGRVFNGQQFVSTVIRGWDNVPTLEQMIQRVRWRYLQLIWPTFWDWLQGKDFFIEKYGISAKEVFLYYEDAELGGYFPSRLFLPSLRFDWKFKPGQFGTADYTDDNPPDGGAIRWWFENQGEAGINIWGNVKRYRSVKALAKAWLYHTFIRRANELANPVPMRDPVTNEIVRDPQTGKPIITGYEASAEGAWLLKTLGITYYEISEKGYRQLIEDTTKLNFLIKEPSDGGQEPGGGQEPDEEPFNKYINEYVEAYRWLKGDGYNSAFVQVSDTLSCDDITVYAKLRVSDIDSRTGVVGNICGNAGSSDGSSYRLLNLAIKTIDPQTFEVGYFGAVKSSASNLHWYGRFQVGDILDIKANANEITINGVSYKMENVNNNTLSKTSIYVLSSGSYNYGECYKGEIASLRFVKAGSDICSFQPCKSIKELPSSMVYSNSAVPIDSAGFWDIINNKYLNQSSGRTWLVNDEE